MIRPAGKFLLNVVAAGAVGLSLVVIVLAFQLSTGPISLGFLSSYLKDALEQTESDFRVDFDDVVLTWEGWDRRIDIRAVGVRVSQKNGDPVASVPAVSIALSGRALLRGEFGLTSIEMFGVKAALVRRADGRVDFGLQDEVAEGGGLSGRLVEELLKPPDPSRMLGYLRRLSILEADITLNDQVSGTTWRAPRADVMLARDEAGIKGIGRISLELGEEVVPLDLDASYNSAARRARVDIRFSGVEPARLQGAGAVFARLAPARVSVSGAVGFTVDAEGVVSELSFDLETGAGHLVLPKYYPKPQPIARIKAKGHFEEGFDVVSLDSFSADLDGPTVAVSGLVWIKGARLAARLEGRLDNVTVAEIKRIWPREVKKNTRRWVMSNLHDGLFSQAAFRIDASPEVLARGDTPEEAFLLDFVFEGLSIAYHGAMPPITNGKGWARLTPANLDLTLAEGEVEGLRISEGTFALEGLNGPHPRAEANAVISGSVRAAVALLDHEPLRYGSAVGLDPSELGGVSATRVKFRFPLKEDLEGREIEFSAASNLSRAAIPNLYGGYDLTEANLSLAVDGRGLSMQGRGLLNGVPAKVAWQRSFGPVAGYRTLYTVSGVYDNAAREALLLPLGKYVKGPVGIDLRVATNDNASPQASADVDLTRARVEVPALLWQKPRGTQGSAKFSLRTVEGGDILIESLTVRGGDLTATGAVRLDSEWALRALAFDRLVYGVSPGTDISVSMHPLDGGGHAIEIGGERLDLRPYLDRLFDEEVADDERLDTPTEVIANVGRAIIGSERELREMSGSALHNGAEWRKLEMAGTLNGEAPLKIAMTPGERTREIKVTSPEASAVLQALGISVGAAGGTLDARATIHDDAPGRPIDGKVVIENFRLVGTPVLARILTLAWPTGIVDTLNGKGIRFERFDGPFTLVDKKVTLVGARAAGLALGITVEGVVDTGTDTLDLQGTIVPAYTLNRVLGKIPLLGPLLVGREGEGVFAVTYSVKGSSEKPRIFVNPLAALAPGFLRRMLFLGAPDDESAPLPQEDREPS